MDLIKVVKNVLTEEATSILKVRDELNPTVIEGVVNAMLNSKGRVVVSGIGKSGIIAQKIAATLASTGTFSFYMHPAEAYHGDLGKLASEDLFFCISRSGETEELIRLIPFIRDNGNFLISMTGNSDSTLARFSNLHVSVNVTEEACTLGLAPTCSTTAALAMGDALSVALLEKRGFREENFARFHPGGSLGKKLLNEVSHVMLTKNLPIVASRAKFVEVVSSITSASMGLAIVVSEDGRLKGIVTDGDLRRALGRKPDECFKLTADDIMTKNPKTIQGNKKVFEAEKIMASAKITSLIVVNEPGKPIGVIQVHSV